MPSELSVPIRWRVKKVSARCLGYWWRPQRLCSMSRNRQAASLVRVDSPLMIKDFFRAMKQTPLKSRPCSLSTLLFRKLRWGIYAYVARDTSTYQGSPYGHPSRLATKLNQSSSYRERIGVDEAARTCVGRTTTPPRGDDGSDTTRMGESEPSPNSKPSIESKPRRVEACIQA